MGTEITLRKRTVKLSLQSLSKSAILPSLVVWKGHACEYKAGSVAMIQVWRRQVCKIAPALLGIYGRNTRNE